MKPYRYWTDGEDRPPMQLLCVGCGAIRPTLHLPELRIDPITRTFRPLMVMALALHVRDKALKEIGDG